MMVQFSKMLFIISLTASCPTAFCIDPKLKALGSLTFGAVTMTAAKKMEKNELMQKISKKTGLDPVDVAGIIGVSAGCLTMGCLSSESTTSSFVKYAIRAPIAGIIGYLVTTETCNDILVNTPLIGEFLARKEKNYRLYDENGKELNIARCKVVDENGGVEKVVGHQYTSNYRCRGTIVATAAYMAVDLAINMLAKKHPSLSFLNGKSIAQSKKIK